MSKITGIFEYMRQCPKLSSLWSIGGKEAVEESVILPQGASAAVQYQEKFDTLGNYNGEIIPYPSVYEDYQINCYKFYDNADSNAPTSNINVMSYEDVASICEWIERQNQNNKFPQIGEDVISVECTPFVPQIRYVNEQENIIAYFVTVRVRYVNRRQRKLVEYVYTD